MKYLLVISLLVSCGSETKYPNGGFDYPKNVVDQDTNFYFYPLKDIEPAKDAFHDSYAYLFFKPFNEPNLSIKPRPKETFRLVIYQALGNSIIITLSQDSILVKKGRPDIIYSEDTSRLSETEKFHLKLLERRFPLDTTGKEPWLKHYLDSLIRLYPELLDPGYYHKIYNKTIIENGEKFNYPLDRIGLKKQQYDSIIHDINGSGFWQMPYQVDCGHDMMDGYGFFLEANTKRKYKVVNATGCPDDTTKFTAACQKLVELAKMDKEIKLVWKGTIDTVHIDLPDVK